MVGIEKFPGVWFYVDPQKVELPQDGARLVSMLEDMADRQLANWIVANFENCIPTLRRQYAEYTLDIIKERRAFHHQTEWGIRCLSIKTEMASVWKDIHDPNDVMGGWRTDGIKNGEGME